MMILNIVIVINKLNINLVNYIFERFIGPIERIISSYYLNYEQLLTFYLIYFYFKNVINRYFLVSILYYSIIIYTLLIYVFVYMIRTIIELINCTYMYARSHLVLNYLLYML